MSVDKSTPIENNHPEVALALLREMAGERTKVPSGANCPKPELDRLRARMRYLIVHAHGGGTAPRNNKSKSASNRNR